MKTLRGLLLSTVAVAVAAPLSMATAQDSSGETVTTDTIRIIGTRRAVEGGTNLDTAVPVDVISGADLQSVASGDLQDVLVSLAPSYNVAESPVDDGGTAVRTPTLRGLPGGEVLILLNGKRIHKSAFISLSGDQDNKVGSHAVDVSQYPVIGASSVQVLRDGAAAQYGSDAIAGVINIQLREDTGFDGYAQYGSTFEGDGDDLQIGLNGGLSLGDQGFANFTLEILESDPTSRGVQRGDAQAFIDTPAALIAAGGDPDAVPRPAQIQGKPNQSWTRFVYNIGYDLSDSTEFYTFGSYGTSEQDGDFFYRNPLGHSTFGTSAIVDPVDPTYRLIDVFPGGFTPRFNAAVDEYNFNIGLRGELENGFSWDLSATTGESEVKYDIAETINASLGSQSPTAVYLGSLTNQETHVNADFVYPVANNVFASALNIAFGFEWRDEEYGIGAGDEAGYIAGPLTDLPIGTSGFAGYSPAIAGSNSRNNTGAYLDLETDLTEQLQIGVAVRAEDYDDFGSTFDYKVSGRFDFTDNFAIRSAFSTGFKAPTVGQVNLVSQNTNFSGGELVVNGILPAADPLAQNFGAIPLQPEESESISAGLVFQGDNGFSAALDFYNIDLEDRIGLSQSFGLSAADLLAFPTTSFRAVRFFANGYDSESKGVDLVVAYETEIGDGDLKLSAGINKNEVEVSNVALFGPTGGQSALIGDRAVFNIENMVPETKGTFTANWDQGPLSLLARVRHFGEWSFAEGNPTDAPSAGGAVSTGATTFFDVALGYDFTENYTITIGADNLFDETGDEYYSVANGNGPDCCGRVFANPTPYSFDGGQYYVKLGFDF